MTPKDKYINIEGIKTRYWDMGQGEKTLILIHGLAASVEYWENNIETLAKQYRVIALDLIGFGRTDKPNIDYTETVFTNFLKSFLDQLHINKCTLIGHSLGGAIALQFTLQFPNMIQQLVLVSSGGFSRKIPLGLRLLTLPFSEKIIKQITPEIMGSIIKHYAYQKNRITKEFIQTMYELRLLPNTNKVLTNILRHHANLFGIKRHILKSVKIRLKQLNIPVLIIWGKEDNLLSVKGAFRAKEWMPHAILKIFDQCSHIPQIEHAKLFNQTVLDFCK